MRLDSAAGAMAMLASGHRAVVPGQSAQSALIKRILSSGADKMPPAYANKVLTTQQKAILRQWVSAGAVYKPHWAFVAPVQAPLPAVRQASWPRNAIDRFVLARLEKASLCPSPQADRYTLIRRVSLDLIGLPPTQAETEAFISDTRPDAYERLVDRLLASPRYGERWARRWLDLARYADTNGFEKDRPRQVWLYRDWVIDALNRDMPFDQFTIEQLAGDMLPNPTLQQRIATGFHRNTMLNEEGGIDPLEYRYYSVVDRVATTGTTWLGLTIGCAQCHSHKFDPITQHEYYRMMACLNNADEVTIDVPRPDAEAKRKKIEAEVAERERGLASKFPVDTHFDWKQGRVASVKTESGATWKLLGDGSVLISGVNPEKDSYTIALENDGAVDAIRLEALPDPSLGGNGPGRTPHGNFVLTRIRPLGGPLYNPISPEPPKFIRAEADFAQNDFPVTAALTGAGGRGWAVDGPGKLGVAHSATFILDRPARFSGGSQWLLRLDQQFGDHHTLGRFRISVGTASKGDGRPIEVRRKEALNARFASWLADQEGRAVRWQELKPVKAAGNVPLLTVEPDNSVFVSGDTTKRDVYDLAFRASGAPITAIRLEALPDDRLPKHGPGRTYYEGGFGDFYLSDFVLESGGKPIRFAGASQNGGSDAAAAIDADPLSGWGINGRQGMETSAVFRLAQPMPAGDFSLKMVFERYFACALGKFRISVTSDTRQARADLPPSIEAILVKPAADRTDADRAALLQQFLTTAPELQPERDAIAMLRQQEPEYPTAFVFLERPESNPRPTFVHTRGEYLQTEEQVSPGIPAILPGLTGNRAMNRLEFARWIVSPQNPLTSRVAVNRQWAAFFGSGIVRTLQDFGYTGEAPSHPELLDWLAVEFQKQGWSLKRLHKLIVMSSTYQQSSRVTPELLAKDPENRLLARGPRVRLEAEMVRDTALTACGLLSAKIGGPSVFPPQPPGVSTEGAYGALNWKVSEGEDRYRRGLYTFSKRTAPYAMFTTFDGPTGEVCVARREVSNTPLQALTLLNDQVFTEVSQAMGKSAGAMPGTDAERAAYLFRSVLTRPPTATDAATLLQFFTAQKARFDAKELDAVKVGGAGDGDASTRAAWTTVARSLLNLDEFVTKR